MSRHVLVITEFRDGTLRQVSFEALTAARQIAEGGPITALVTGDRHSDVTEELARYGATRVLFITHEQLRQPIADVYVQAWMNAVEQEKPDAILAPHTAVGKDVSPRVAVKLDVGLITDCTAIRVENGRVVFTRPIYAGKAFMKKAFKSEKRLFATIRPNNVTAEPVDTPAEPVETTVNLELPDDAVQTSVERVERKATSGVDLSEARIVVAGGRGVKSEAGFEPLYELADVLKAAVGASRGACDAGYCDYALQIGQTGKVVTPELYIACGISGAIQHLAGMSNSKVIVAINKDPDANIFKVADYGIVGDLFEVVPKLAEQIRRVWQSA